MPNGPFKIVPHKQQELQKYIDDLAGLIDNVVNDLQFVSAGLKQARQRITTIPADQLGGVNWSQIAAAVSQDLQAAVPHTGVNLGRLLLEVNARVCNIPLLLAEPVQPAQEPAPE